ncbi:RHS repeat domain-containing protein [Streptomyces sp. NPDC059810]|uniref:RHS repeat domain-containing protein n=1 Tax=Streptomyces sp. NPDC059810 TaxID=3346956 RepID=UPI003652E28D
MSTLGVALALVLLPVDAMALPPDPAKGEIPRDELVLEELPENARVTGQTRNAGLKSIETPAPDDLDEAPAGTATPPPGGSAPVTFGTAPVQPSLHSGSAPSRSVASSTSEEPGGLLPAGNLPVKLGQAPGEDAPSGTWGVNLSSRTSPEGEAIDGALVTVTAPATGSVPVSVQLEYKKYANLYGADWASRLTFVQFPECFRDTPELEECQTYEELETVNDATTKTLTATVDTAADGTVTPAVAPQAATRSGLHQALFVSSAASGGDRAVVGAIDSGRGEGGSFKSTPLASNGSWMAGGSSGSFSWTYPLTVPPAPAGPAPDIAFAYNSQAVDGKTATTSPQASWIGEGWEYDPGHIERRYRSCRDDREATADGTPNNTAKKDKTSDLCWVSHNAVITLNGKSMELVRVGETDVYKPQQDDGTRVELKNDGVSNDNNGENWVVTTPDGTTYHYGLNRIGEGHADTNSVLTVPVFGNHPGEPCYAATFAASRCNGDEKKQQAWFWGLDKVVDAHGNVMIVNWAKEQNNYAVNKKFKSPETYDRGGLPRSIEYGLRAGALGGAPAARVDFVLKERCLQDAATCAPARFDNTKDPAAYRLWWDSPGSLNCKSDSKLCPAFPSFWNRQRLAEVVTYAHRPGVTGLAKVDTYRLHQSFPRDWYDSSPGLWLNSIKRYGHRPGDDVGSLMSPAGVSFAPYVAAETHPLGGPLKDQQLPNLVPRYKGDPRPGITRPRIGSVTTENGGEIEVVYDGGCRVQPSVDPKDNAGTCYPVRWSPDGDADKPALAWFNKYVVHSVTETDKITGVSDRVTTQYSYKNAAWGMSDDEFIKPALRTYSAWRGYQQVTTIKGGKAATGGRQPQSLSVTRYFRGVGGVMTDSKGAETLAPSDSPAYAGMPAENIVYSGSGGTVVRRVLSFPWSKQTASRPRAGGLEPLVAHQAGVRRTDAIQTLDSGWQTVRTEMKVDAYGFPTEVESAVVKPNGTGGESLGDYTCMRTEYVHNPDAHLLGMPKSVRKTGTSCDDFGSADPATELMESEQFAYDGLEWGERPKKGLVTSVAGTNAEGDAHDVVTRTTYDPLGRVRTVTSPLVGTTETRYTPGDTGGATTSVAVINSKNHETVTTFDPGRGLQLTVRDPNGRVVRSEHDAFGRVVKQWSPTRSPGAQSPDVQIAYQSAAATTTVTRPASVTVQRIKDDGSYAKQVTIYDGLMRPVQTQREAHGPGRIISDTWYDDHGLVKEQTGAYVAKGEPTAAQFKRMSDTLVPNLTRTEYDGLERPVRVSTFFSGAFAHSTSTTYGDSYTQTRPAGGASPAVKSWTDALGRVTQVQHATNTAATSWRNTSYTYDTRGNLAKVVDPAGNAWTYTYADARSRLTASKDPDTGSATYGYDAADRRTRVSDSKGSTYTTYDELNRVTAVRKGSESGSPTKEFTYDTLPGALGLQAASIRHDPSGDYINRVTGYDTAYRITGTEKVIPANQMTTGVDGVYGYTYAYTPTGRPLSVTLPAKGGLAREKVVTRYNGDGLAESTSGIDWYTTDATYSPYGEPLRTVSGPQPYRVWTTNFVDEHTGRVQRSVVDRETANSHRISDSSYSYDLAGNITSSPRKLTDGATSRWDSQCFTYDALGQLVHAWTSSIAPTTPGTGCKSASGTTWGPRADGKISSGPVAEAANSVDDSGTPDAALTNSLAGASPATGSVAKDATSYWQSFRFDVIGNRLSLVEHNPAGSAGDVTLTYGYGTLIEGAQITSSYRTQPHTLASVSSSAAGGSSTFASDAAGNTTRRNLPTTSQTLDWSDEDKLVSLTEKGETTKYVYDADGNRVLENTSTGSVLYLGETELTTEAGKIAKANRTYTQQGAPSVLRSATNGATAGHTLTVLITDHLGTATTAVTQAANQPVVRRYFKPYGETRGSKPAWPNRRSYLGVGIDDPSGLTHVGAREYDSSTGRFVSADPVMDVTDPLQMNGYTYALGNPVTKSDPSGLWPDWMTSAKDSAKGAWHGFVDWTSEMNEGWHRLTGDGAEAERIRRERENKIGPVNGTQWLKNLAGSPSNSFLYRAVYAAVKMLMPLLPGAGMATKAPTVAAKAASKLASGAGKVSTGAAKAGTSGSIRTIRSGFPAMTPTPRGPGSQTIKPVVKVIPASPGWTDAGQLRTASDSVADFALSNRTKATRNRTYVGGYNIDTGDIALASSGGCHPGQGYCAEGNVVWALGGDASRVVFTVARWVRGNADAGYVAEVKPVCSKCQVDYPNGHFFENGIEGHAEGIWNHRGDLGGRPWS